MRAYFLLIFLILQGCSLLPLEESTDSRFVDGRGNVTDPIVSCLGLTGIMIQGEHNKDSGWPQPLLTLNSRRLGEVTNAVQGRLNPDISWKMEGKRWEMYNSLLTANTAKKVMEIGLNDLRFKNDVWRREESYQGILLLGAAAGRFYERVQFANTAINKAEVIYILTGERPLEKFEKEQFPFLTKMTDEGEMAWAIFKKYAIPQLQKNVVFVYSKPPKGSARATTESTVHAFMKQNPKPGKYLAISNSYFIPYQELVIQNCLDKFYPHSGIIVEGVGFGDHEPLEEDEGKKLINRASIFLDNLSRILYNLQIKFAHK